MPDNVMLDGPTLRRRRDALGLSQSALARALSVEPITISRWERGHKDIGNPNLVHLALQALEQQPRPAPQPAANSRRQETGAMESTAFGWSPVEILTADVSTEGSSAIYRKLCAHIGLEISPFQTGPGQVIVPAGYGSPYAMARTLRAAVGSDDATVMTFTKTNERGLTIAVTWAAFHRDGNTMKAALATRPYPA